ncbi:5'-3'-deoxyribonucleotidase [Snodgrassella alvi]|uniref:5' nucleotidase, NT5C type n=1 Tax=Snodgrassella alvi TaxID=1196083 RepID=UPI00352CAF7F
MAAKLILLDQDGVLADFEQGVRQRWQLTYQQPLPLPERRHFYLREDMAPQYHQQLTQIYSSKGFFASLPPMNLGIQAARRLLEAGHDVRICTSPIDDYQYCVSEKFDWVARYLGDEWLNRIILAKDKTWIRGDILIDDKPMISGSLKPQWQHWIYDQPYNRNATNIHRVNWQKPESWSELLQ